MRHQRAGTRTQFGIILATCIASLVVCIGEIQRLNRALAKHIVGILNEVTSQDEIRVGAADQCSRSDKEVETNRILNRREMAMEMRASDIE